MSPEDLPGSPRPQTETENWIARYEACSWNAFGRRRIVLSHGKGSRVWDVEGKEYLDFLTGIAVNNLGHCHPAIVEAIQKQAATLIHCTNIYYIPVQIEWAECLQKYAFSGAKAFFANSGCEANEAMIKLARRYAHEHFAPERRTIVTFTNSFHGRTMATLTATAQEKFHKGFEPLMPGFLYSDFNDCEALRRLVAAREKEICAILIEPVQGEGGVYPATQAFMDTLAELRERTGLLLLFDEVQSGLGRTGKNFSYEHFGVLPDALTLAKPVGGGLAAGAILANEKLVEVATPGSFGGTMIGNPMASAGGLAYCKILFEEKLADRAARMGETILKTLRSWVGQIPCITEVRGLGLILGLSLDRPGADVVQRCEERGLLINCTAGNVVRLLPPLNVSQEDVDWALTVLREELEREPAGA